MNQYPPQQPQYPAQYAPQYPAQGVRADYVAPVRRTVRHIGVFSAAKVVAMMSALIYAVFGLVFLGCGLVCGGLIASAIPRIENSSGFGSSNFGTGAIAANFVVSIITYVVVVILAAVFGFITGAIYAWIYNLTVGLTGGLEVDVA